MRWQDVSPGLYRRLRESSSTQVLSLGHYPPGFEKVSNVESVCVWKTSAPTRFVLDGKTVNDVVGGLDVFRRGTKSGGPQIKSDRYLIAESTSGEVSMLGPFKDSPHGHHLEALPPWATPRSDSGTSQ